MTPAQALRASLGEQARTKLNEARGILTAAAAAKRGLTAAESTTHARLLAEVDEIQGQRLAVAPETQAVRQLGSEGRSRRAARYADPEARAALFESGEVRDMMAGSLTKGGTLVPAAIADFVVDGLHAESIALRAGVRDFPTDRASFELPTMKTDPSAGWYGEVEEIAASEGETGVIVNAIKYVKALVPVSNTLLNFSNPSALDLLFSRIIRSGSLAVDLGIFEGTGFQNQIRGIAGRPGISSDEMGANGAAFADLDEFADAIGTLETSNARPTAIVMHPRTWKDLTKIKTDTTDSTKPLLQEFSGSGGEGIQRRIYGLPVFLSSQLSVTETQGSAANASSVYVAQWDQAVLVRMQDMRIELDRSRLFHKDMSEIRLVLQVDFCLLNEPAFYQLKGVIPAS